MKVPPNTPSFAISTIFPSGGSDFGSVDATIIIDAGEEEGCFDVTVLPDSSFEKAQYFSLLITAVEENVTLHTDILTLHIQDDDSERAVAP
jgi:hypothetical protein